MAAAIGLWDHFRKLATFHGREDRASFWPYAALVLAIVMVAGTLAAVPTVVPMMRDVPQSNVQLADPDHVAESYGLNDLSAPALDNGSHWLPSAGSIAAYLAATLGMAVLLYAAAVVRRLHNRGKSGWWGALPLPFICYSSVQIPRMFGSLVQGGEPDTGLFFSIVVSNLLYLLALGTLIVLLVGASDPEPNGYDLREGG